MPKPREHIMHECLHCEGQGEVPVYCDDCGEELYTDNVSEHDQRWNPDHDDICKACLDIRKEDAAEQARDAEKPNG